MTAALACAYCALALTNQATANHSAANQVSLPARVYATAADERGNPVVDLRASDLVLREDEVQRAIEDVRFIDTASEAATEALGAIASRADEAAEAAREGTRLFAFFLDEYHVSPEAAAAVRTAVSQFVTNHIRTRDMAVVFKPLESLFGIRLTRDQPEWAAAIAAFEGRRGAYQPRTAFERDVLAADPERAASGRRQISVAAVQALVTHLGALDAGRKTLVIVSESLGRSAASGALERIGRAAERAGVSIYIFDPAGEPSSADEGEAFARARDIVARTGGRAAAGDLTRGLAQLSRDVRGYYVVTFRSETPQDGSTQPVRIAAARPGVVIRASRPPVARSSSTEMNPPLPKTMWGPARRTSALIRPWFGFARTDEGRARVSFVWEPVRRLVSRSSDRMPARVVLRVSTMDGGDVLFEGPVRSVYGPAAESRATFSAPPGRLLVEMRVEDETFEYLDADVRDVFVAPQTGPLSLGTPAVFRTRNAREWRALLSDPNATPVASREFSRAEQLLVRVPVASSGAPVISAALKTGFGHTMRAMEVAPGPESGVWQIELPLAGLASGDYRLEVTAGDAGVTVLERLAFRVTP